MFRLIHTGGPYGDETSSYEIDFSKEMTFGEFVCAVLEKYPREWGSFRLGLTGPSVVEYNYGKIIHVDYSFTDLRDKKILAATSDGGWSLMDYYLTLEKD